MEIRAFWEKFRKTIYFRILYLVLVSLLAALMAPTTVGCLSLILVPVLMILVPHSFGERSFRNHAVNGVVIVLLTTVLYAAMVTPDIESRPQAAQVRTDPDANLKDGLVTPFRGSAGTDFNFTVNVTSSHADRKNFTIQLQVLDIQALGRRQALYEMFAVAGGDGELSNGENYSVVTRLTDQLHQFNFRVLNPVNATTNVIVAETLGSWGPFNGSFGTYYGTIAVNFSAYMLFVALGFYVLLLGYWWTRKAREMRGPALAEARRKRAEGGGEFTCTNCGADVGEGDAKCPSCGAEFESEASGEPAKGGA